MAKLFHLYLLAALTSKIIQMFESILTFLLAIYHLIFPIPITKHTDINTIQTIFNSTGLTKRAKPNQRLVLAFQINNAFTTTDQKTYLNFLRQITHSLEKFDNDASRIELYNNAVNNGREYLAENGDEASFSHLVQIVVFRTVLTIFFPHLHISDGSQKLPESGNEKQIMSNESILLISERINTLWYASKSPFQLFFATYFPRWSSIIRDRTILLRHLSLHFPHYNPTSPPSRNPLNTLIPSHQGLWRLVLKALIEIRFRSSVTNSQQQEWMSLFREYVQSPEANWHKPNANGLEPQMIIAELTRLYPVTRRMYIQQPPGSINAVDIETLHRTGDIWGSEPLRFRPERWVSGGLDVVATREYMPFGRKVEGKGKQGEMGTMSQCPSRKRGGPKLIAMLVGALLEVLGEGSGWELVDDGMERKDSRNLEGWGPLRSERDAYASLRLRRRGAGGVA